MPRLTALSRTAAISMLIALLLFGGLEGILRLFAPQNIRVSYQNNPPLAEVDSVLGHRPHPGCSAILEGPEFTVRYRINEQGFRDRRLRDAKKRGSGIRVLLVGDSFAFGAGNDYDDIWPVIFEQRLLESGLDVDVVKAGVLGYDTRSEVRYLERLLPLYRPDFVILTLLPNDLLTNTALEAPPESPPAGGKPTRLHLVRLASRLLLSWDRLYTGIYLSTPRKALFEVPESARFVERAAVTRGLLQRGRDLCRAFDAELVVLSLPQQFQVLYEAGGGDRDGVDVRSIDRNLGSFAAGIGVPWVEALSALAGEYRRTGEDLYYRFDGHLTPPGNRVVGARLYEEFLRLYGNAGAVPSGERR